MTPSVKRGNYQLSTHSLWFVILFPQKSASQSQLFAQMRIENYFHNTEQSFSLLKKMVTCKISLVNCKNKFALGFFSNNMHCNNSECNVTPLSVGNYHFVIIACLADLAEYWKIMLKTKISCFARKVFICTCHKYQQKNLYRLPTHILHGRQSVVWWK